MTGSESSPHDPRIGVETLLDAVISNAPLVLFAADSNGVITMSRGKALSALGLAEGELVGRSVFDLYENEPEVAAAARRCLAGESVIARLDLDGVIHETLFSPLFSDGQVTGIVGVATDVTERARAEAQLRYQATHNLRTALPNRSFFVERLDEALRTARTEAAPLARLVIVIERFGEVSETFGFDVGTQLLQATAERLRGAATGDEQLGTLEAGKFALLAPLRLRTAREIADRLIDTLSAPFIIDGEEISVLVHIGMAAFPGHADHGERLIQAAERAARAAEAARLPYAVYEPRLVDGRRNFTLLSDLRAALDAGALRVEYQPLLAIGNRSLHSLETLVRWEHPREGAIPPGEFLPVAAQGGLLPRVTGFVLEQVARQLYIWEQRDFRPHIAINIPPAEILSPELERAIRPPLETWGMGLDRLTLEVTEDDSLGEVSAPQSALLTRLTNDGMAIAIDDFGTGYSNLGSLNRLPWSQLKVDRSFIGELDGAEPTGLVAAVIDLGHLLGREVVAEGVETQGQWDALRELGCDVAQGYHISASRPPEAIIELCRRSGWAVAG